ncbi:MAG TPA: potassium transporter TrkA [Micrococcales bacterium]|uniref:Trk system potassium uptake protein TrkA n=1 Tax=Miniimonas arenae TaxID=676201 RepID=A0A5C5BF02_9MICO|nr:MULTISPECIES: TrkA family potassium uptake protein [Miniimonas]TNU76094.1 TrkA family potassium uptake protein [Miniimonas arenae]HCX84800.1 potassium transporter TrkA [Micrococcales bacterium]
MKAVIAGAGSVGRSIARELLGHGHDVTLIDRNPAAMRVASVSRARWLLGDACEMATLEQAGLEDCDVVVAATGDDKVNLVLSLIARTEFAVPRTVARVNNPKNEWMFDETWGVDVPVSTPRIMTALVEEAVSVGDLVKLFELQSSGAGMYEVALPDSSPLVGRRVGEVAWPLDVVLATIIRSNHPIPPSPDDALEGGDQLLFVVADKVDAHLSPDGTPVQQLQRVLDAGPAATSATAPAPTAAAP